MTTKNTIKFNKNSILITLILALCLVSNSFQGIQVASCPGNCKTCKSNGECEECKTGYRLTSSKTCEQCTESGCGNCDSDKDTCTACAGGYYVSSRQVGVPITVTCTECPDNHCFRCKESDPQVCESCDAGFDVTDGGDCELSRELLKILLLYIALPLIIILIIIVVACCSCKKTKKSKHYHYHDQRQAHV